VAVFDGDEAGEKERKDLQGYFGKKSIPFEANSHFVSVRSRFAIEGLFPDDWIKIIHEEHPSWFDSFAVDAGDELEPFKVKDGKKSQMQAKLISLAQNEKNLGWAIRFINVFQTIDSALDSLHQKLES
jgi:hypothetical protein